MHCDKPNQKLNITTFHVGGLSHLKNVSALSFEHAKVVFIETDRHICENPSEEKSPHFKLLRHTKC